MLSLDGADTITLHRYYKEGKLDAGGFARFFREGQVADALIPANPSITAPNHITLATGYPTGKTGIVANDIRLPGMPLSKTVSGFSAEIHTETLWEAARRQGLRVATSGWPGADARGERRTADWGMIYTGSAVQEPELRTVRDWKGPLKPGEWALVPCREGETRPGCWVKVLEVLESDPPTARMFFGGEYRLRGYPEAFDRALHEAGLVWSGEPDEDLLEETWAGRPGIDLDTWVEQAEIFSTFFMDALLAAARFSEWDLLMAYTPVIDEAGHQLLLADPRQPGYSPERAAELEAGRLRVWQSVDRELARLLAAVDLRTTTVLVVSDHGMMPAHTEIDVDTLLREWGLLALEADGKTPKAESRADSVSAGGICHVYLQPGLPDADRLLKQIRRDLGAWSDRNGHPILRMLTRSEAAEIEMDHPNSGDLILVTEPGYVFRHEDDPVTDTPLFPTDVYGMHGYLNHVPAVHASYLALGAGIRKGNAGTFRNTEVAGRVADWLGIEKPRERP
jgi:predicted AlkP superfamily pyrophosphatase or phosphodiesterase